MTKTTQQKLTEMSKRKKYSSEVLSRTSTFRVLARFAFIRNHRRSQGGPEGPWPTQIFGKHSHFVL